MFVDTEYDIKYNNGISMSRWDKLLEKFLSLNQDVRFEEIVKVLKWYGYEVRQPKGGSSHYSFVKPGRNRIVIPRHKPIKKAYIQLVKELIEEEMKYEQSNSRLLHESCVSYGSH